MKEAWFKPSLADHNKLLNVFVKIGYFLKAENRYRKMLSKGGPKSRLSTLAKHSADLLLLSSRALS